MFAIPGSRKGYYQWDINQRLYIQDSRCNEVHFCSEKHPEALTCLVQEESGKRYVQVPNILLQYCLPITAFFYVRGNADAYTKRSFVIEIWERPKPDDYVYTETEVKTWETAVEYALQEAKESGAFKGDRGEKGEKGDTGEQGPQGEKGDKGDGFLTEADKLELAIRCCAEGVHTHLKDAAALPLAGLQVFGKTLHNEDAPSGLENAGDSGNISVVITGRNMLNLCPNTADYKNRGVTFHAKDGGTRLYGTSSDGYAQNKVTDYGAIHVPSGTYTLKMEVSGETDGAKFCVRIVRDGVTVGSAIGTASGSATFAMDAGVTYSCFVYMEEAGKTVDCVVRAMLVPGEEPAQWEAYTAQTLTIPTPNGLPGIPVASGGNYTDASGQRWLAHIAGYAQDGQIGEWVATGYIESYAGETIPGAYISSTGDLRMGASVRYALETPEFTPYEADMQAQWSALRTNKPNTTIYNDAVAWMQVSYAADTKTYIDNKFAELASAIVNNT